MNALTITTENLIIAANIFMDGGPLFMTLILICLLASLFFLARGFMKVNTSLEVSNKMLKLASDASLLGLVMGFLASIIGLITAFDSVEAMGDPDPSIFAGGLKISLLTASFGLFTFVVARVGIIILRMMTNANTK